MDLTPYMSGIFALGGAFFGVIGTVVAQCITQRNENIRHARKLAYDVGVREWEAALVSADRLRAAGRNVNLAPLDDFILLHLGFLARLDKIKPGEFTVADMAPLIESERRRFDALVRLRGEIDEKLRQERAEAK